LEKEKGEIMTQDERKGFTLIELLVVISIIALLLSVILPSLGKVKQKAQGLVCRTHLKDMGTMTNLYMQANNNRFVSNQYAAGGTGSNAGRWTTRLGKYYEMNDDSAGGHDRYNTEIFFCPVEWRKRKVADEEGRTDYFGQNAGYYYEINGLICDSGDLAVTYKCKFSKSTTWMNPASLPLFHDANSDVPAFKLTTWDQMYPAQNLANYGWQLGDPRNPKLYRFGPAANHGAGINYLFGDFHVEMTLWPYEGTMSNPEKREYYYRFWHPRGDLSIKTNE
jgi:prepilin-type N-terminal cleavage/methylation domain-containing protein/prepilin-type processing-associated H-X9-DG protein